MNMHEKQMSLLNPCDIYLHNKMTLDTGRPPRLRLYVIIATKRFGHYSFVDLLYTYFPVQSNYERCKN